MCSGITSPGSATRPSGNRLMTLASAFVMPGDDDRLKLGFGRSIRIVAEVGQRDDPVEQVDEVEVERVGVRVRVHQRERDLATVLPGERHRSPLSAPVYRTKRRLPGLSLIH